MVNKTYICSSSIFIFDKNSFQSLGPHTVMLLLEHDNLTAGWVKPLSPKFVGYE